MMVEYKHYDIEEARRLGMSEETIAEMQESNANLRREESCATHKFVRISEREYVCENCGCKACTEFVAGYERGFKHGFDRASFGGAVPQAKAESEDKA